MLGGGEELSKKSVCPVIQLSSKPGSSGLAFAFQISTSLSFLLFFLPFKSTLSEVHSQQESLQRETASSKCICLSKCFVVTYNIFHQNISRSK